MFSRNTNVGVFFCFGILKHALEIKEDLLMAKKEPRPPDLEKYLVEEKKHDFISYAAGARFYGMPYWPFVRLAKIAGATWSLRRTAVVDMRVLDAYIEEHLEENEKENKRMAGRKKIENIEDLLKAKQKKYLRFDEAREIYSVGRHTLEKWIKDAGAVRKVNNIVLINVEKLDAFIEANYVEED